MIKLVHPTPKTCEEQILHNVGFSNNLFLQYYHLIKKYEMNTLSKFKGTVMQNEIAL